MFTQLLWRPSQRGTMFCCSLKIIGHVPLFPKSDFQNFYLPCSPKSVLFSSIIFHFSLKINGHVPLFPKTLPLFSWGAMNIGYVCDLNHSWYTVNSLKFRTLYSILFWPKFCFICICCLKYLVSFKSSLIFICTVCICHFVRHFGVCNFRTFTILFCSIFIAGYGLKKKMKNKISFFQKKHFVCTVTVGYSPTHDYSAALKKWGYTGFALSFCHCLSVLLSFLNHFSWFFFVTLFSVTVKCRGLNFVDTWTVGGCVVYTRIIITLFLFLYFYILHFIYPTTW